MRYLTWSVTIALANQAAIAVPFAEPPLKTTFNSLTATTTSLAHIITDAASLVPESYQGSLWDYFSYSIDEGARPVIYCGDSYECAVNVDKARTQAACTRDITYTGCAHRGLLSKPYMTTKLEKYNEKLCLDPNEACRTVTFEHWRVRDYVCMKSHHSDHLVSAWVAGVDSNGTEVTQDIPPGASMACINIDTANDCITSSEYLWWLSTSLVIYIGSIVAFAVCLGVILGCILHLNIRYMYRANFRDFNHGDRLAEMTAGCCENFKLCCFGIKPIPQNADYALASLDPASEDSGRVPEDTQQNEELEVIPSPWEHSVGQWPRISAARVSPEFRIYTSEEHTPPNAERGSHYGGLRNPPVIIVENVLSRQSARQEGIILDDFSDTTVVE